MQKARLFHSRLHSIKLQQSQCDGLLCEDVETGTNPPALIGYNRFMLSHFQDGKAVMVDVSDKDPNVRTASAEAWVYLPAAAAAALTDNAKGDPIAVAELAGIMAAKRTSELIPLCHPLPLSKVSVRGEVRDVPEDTKPEGAGVAGVARAVHFESQCRVTARTGVEMEALTAVSVAALTLYDMLKSADKGIEIAHVRLLHKEGGKSGSWHVSPK